MPKYKIYKIAKELNLASTTIIEHLDSMGHSVPKGHMSTIDEELYHEVLKKFDRALYQELQDEAKPDKVLERRKISERAREEELEKILSETAEISIEHEPEPEEVPEKEIVEEQPPEKPEIKKEVDDVDDTAKTKAVTKEKKKKKPEKQPEPTESVAQPVEAAPEEKKEAEADKKKAEKGKKKKDSPMPGTFEALMADAKTDDMVARARELARKRDAKEEGVAPEPAKKRHKRKKKELTEEELTVEKAVERAKKTALERKKAKREAPKAKAAKEKPAEAAPSKRSRRRRRSKKARVDQKVVDASIKQTLASMEEKKPRKRRRKVQDVGEVLEDENVLKVMEFIPTNDLAALLDVPVSELIRKCLDMGLQVTINQRLDRDAIELLVGDYGYDIEFISEFDGVEEVIEEEEEAEENLKPRPPVVTVMGHVDHGKTSLLDHIRKSNIVAGESGGITQHIGAYSVTYQNKPITFLDTPGHEAFTAMRARGAHVTDLVVLVVAADDHVMPQTTEAINHAKAAGVPIIIAINKVDKPTADPDLIRRELSEKDILVEEWGGKYQCALVSAKSGDGIENLLEEITLAAEVLDLKANPDRNARAIIIESRLDKGRGPLATVLVQQGTLKLSNNFVGGAYAGRVKALFDEYGKKIKKVGPGFPVQVLGFDGTPQAGESFLCLDSEKETKAISLKRQALQREQAFKQIRVLSLEGLSAQIKSGEVRELPLIIKGDVNGSVEALSDSLMKLNSEEVGVNIIHRGVGAITETDVNLAAASSALIIGFMVHPNLKSREVATQESVEIRVYRIIYDVINDVKAALEGMLAPDVSEKNVGTLEVRQTFKVPKLGMIAGCYVQAGKIERNSRVRLIRDGQEVYEGEVCSLKRFKDDAKEVKEGFECGVGIQNFNDMKESDVIEVYELVETKRTLA
ncbi:translation initiation factor IF-2 [candidate division LCP-89 bacterium B3_LCP]|uniref:Translation initiation factor IF-2 n=1 Tax=candidate division LCP-89 bacterium B3_LCP TaxID=2012998 RepID=A0A532V3H7_UNCL8|nr:MAG: translation initiation factor IF-2 [candidate division LCP-89 bacterium B3_LCP]